MVRTCELTSEVTCTKIFKNMTGNQKFKLCRLCLCTGHKLMDIFEEDDTENIAVEEAIQDLLKFRAVKDPDFPWLICSSCLAKLTDFRLFKMRCIECKIAFEIRYFGKELSTICIDDEDYIKKEPNIQLKSLRDVHVQTDDKVISSKSEMLEVSGDKSAHYQFPIAIKKEVEDDYENLQIDLANESEEGARAKVPEMESAECMPSVCEITIKEEVEDDYENLQVDLANESEEGARAKVPEMESAECMPSVCEIPIKMEEVDLNEEEMKQLAKCGIEAVPDNERQTGVKEQEAVTPMEISEGEGEKSETIDISGHRTKSKRRNVRSILRERLSQHHTAAAGSSISRPSENPVGGEILPATDDPKLPTPELVPMDLQTKAIVSLFLVRNRRLQRQRKWWLHPLISERATKGKFVVLHEKLKENPTKFFEFYRMSVTSFNNLLALVHQHLQREDTLMREAIRAEEKLAVTLRHLGSGCSFRSLHLEYLLGRSTVAGIVKETCTVIWENLRKEYMKDVTKEDWLEISRNFQSRANFPNCVGAVDGKQIRIASPSQKGSIMSIVLTAIADPDYSFTHISIGACGRSSDPYIFQETTLGKKLLSEQLQLPEPSVIPNDDENSPVPYVFIIDEDFPMCKNFVCPYPCKNLTPERRLFNYRHSRARRSVDCAFGVLSNKWKVLNKPISVDPEFADTIIKACVVLHNYVRKLDGYLFEDTLFCNLESVSTTGIWGNQDGMAVRDHLARYFSSPKGEIPLKNKHI